MAFGLLPFGQGEVRRIALAGILKPARHLPAMFEIEIARNAHQLFLEEGELARRHRLRIDARPHAMRMAAAFLFVEDDRARLILQPEPLFDSLDRVARRSRPAPFAAPAGLGSAKRDTGGSSCRG